MDEEDWYLCEENNIKSKIDYNTIKKLKLTKNYKLSGDTLYNMKTYEILILNQNIDEKTKDEKNKNIENKKTNIQQNNINIELERMKLCDILRKYMRMEDINFENYIIKNILDEKNTLDPVIPYNNIESKIAKKCNFVIEQLEKTKKNDKIEYSIENGIIIINNKKIKISDDIYDWIKKINNDEKKILMLIIRYFLILNIENKNYYYSIKDDFKNTLIKIFNVKYKCFTSPFTFSFNNYYSLFPDIDKYFKSLGNFFSVKSYSIDTYFASITYNYDISNFLIEKLLNIISINEISMIIILSIDDFDNINNKNKELLIEKIKKFKYTKKIIETKNILINYINDNIIKNDISNLIYISKNNLTNEQITYFNRF